MLCILNNWCGWSTNSFKLPRQIFDTLDVLPKINSWTSPVVDLNRSVVNFSGPYEDLSNGGFQFRALEDAISISEPLVSFSTVESSIFLPLVTSGLPKRAFMSGMAIPKRPTCLGFCIPTRTMRPVRGLAVMQTCLLYFCHGRIPWGFGYTNVFIKVKTCFSAAVWMAFLTDVSCFPGNDQKINPSLHFAISSAEQLISRFSSIGTMLKLRRQLKTILAWRTNARAF